MVTLIKSIELADYQELNGTVRHIQEMTHTICQNGCRVDWGHDHRMWEYGRAITALEQMYKEKMSACHVLEVGSGWSPLGPILAVRYGVNVTECEPDKDAYDNRELMMSLCNKRAKFSHIQTGVESLPDETYDAVFCISVLEHVDAAFEKQAWLELAKRVKPNGLLFITTDVVPEAGKSYRFDELRRTNYTMDVIHERVDMLSKAGMCPLGQPDYQYHGSFVYDFSFASVGMMRAEANKV